MASIDIREKMADASLFGYLYKCNDYLLELQRFLFKQLCVFFMIITYVIGGCFAQVFHTEFVQLTTIWRKNDVHRTGDDRRFVLVSVT